MTVRFTASTRILGQYLRQATFTFSIKTPNQQNSGELLVTCKVNNVTIHLSGGDQDIPHRLPGKILTFTLQYLRVVESLTSPSLESVANSEDSFHTAYKASVEDIYHSLDYNDLQREWEIHDQWVWENSHWFNEDFWESHEARS